MCYLLLMALAVSGMLRRPRTVIAATVILIGMIVLIIMSPALRLHFTVQGGYMTMDLLNFSVTTPVDRTRNARPQHRTPPRIRARAPQSNA